MFCLKGSVMLCTNHSFQQVLYLSCHQYKVMPYVILTLLWKQASTVGSHLSSNVQGSHRGGQNAEHHRCCLPYVDYNGFLKTRASFNGPYGADFPDSDKSLRSPILFLTGSAHQPSCTSDMTNESFYIKHQREFLLYKTSSCQTTAHIPKRTTISTNTPLTSNNYKTVTGGLKGSQMETHERPHAEFAEQRWKENSDDLVRYGLVLPVGIRTISQEFCIRMVKLHLREA